tara:strand:- start:729 stop:1043 length:315 start_codon:yes stop_codon:yes gene_type:complete
MQVDPRMYDRPMTEEEKRLMMIQGLRQNNMSMANAEQDMMNDPSMEADRTRGVPMPDSMNPTLRNEQPYSPPVERISPMGSPMTPQEIDEEIMRLQMLKQTMGT